MENGAYEDEPSSRKLHPHHSLEETPRVPLRKLIRPTELFRMDSSTSPDSHIYEDITSGASAGNSGSSPFRTTSIVRLPNLEFSRPEIQNSNRLPIPENRFYSNSEIEQDSLNSFHRNLTLPLRRANPLRDSVENVISSSVRVTSRERIRAGSAVCENGSTIDENSKYTSGPIPEVHSEQRHAKRRRKKDCKHCKNRTNSEFSSTSEVPVDVPCSERLYEENEFRVEQRNGKSRLGIEPIFSLPEGRLPSFCNSRCEKTGRTSSVYCISNNVNVSGNVGAGQGNVKTLNYDKNDIEARLAHVEVCEDKALITPPKNSRAGMKVNSIYAQEHWHTKDAPIFLTDIKEQSPFQVRLGMHDFFCLQVRHSTFLSDNALEKITTESYHLSEPYWLREDAALLL